MPEAGAVNCRGEAHFLALQDHSFASSTGVVEKPEYNP
jgi:hypothetical protein